MIKSTLKNLRNFYFFFLFFQFGLNLPSTLDMKRKRPLRLRPFNSTTFAVISTQDLLVVPLADRPTTTFHYILFLVIKGHFQLARYNTGVQLFGPILSISPSFPGLPHSHEQILFPRVHTPWQRKQWESNLRPSGANLRHKPTEPPPWSQDLMSMKGGADQRWATSGPRWGPSPPPKRKFYTHLSYTLLGRVYMYFFLIMQNA